MIWLSPRCVCRVVLMFAWAVVVSEPTLLLAQARIGLATFISRGEKPAASFSLPTQPTDVRDSIDEFQRMVEHEQWEKAFKSLEAIAAKNSAGFIDRGDGVLVPGRSVVRQLLVALPAAGKSAYRLFYDPQAATLWDGAKDQREQANLSTIVVNHLISSFGDRAADRLGDLYYEQGNYDEAAGAWRTLLNYCRDSKIPRAQTLAKLATAAARAGRGAEFRDARQQLFDDHSGESVTIAGKQLPVAEYLELVGHSVKADAAVADNQLPDDLELPTSNDLLWQFSFLSKVDPQNPQQQPFQIIDNYGRQRGNDFNIPTAIDGQRVYVNALGIEMAFDLATGKLAWRSGKLYALQQQQNRQIAPELFGMQVHRDRLYSVTRELQQNNSPATGFGLVARDVATGKELYNTRRTLSSWSIWGQPLFLGDVIYVGGTRTNQARELSLLAINAKDGKLIKNTALGNYAVDHNQVYGERLSEPTLLLHGDRMFVDTNAGAVVCLQPQSGNVEWGFLYESPAPSTGYNYYNYQPTIAAPRRPLVGGGLLFAKGMRSSRLVGVDPEGPTLAWNRPIDKTAVLVGIDDERIYTGGEELSAYSLKNQELLWSTPLPRSAGWSMPLLTRNRLYQFTSRGVCEVDKRTGNVLKIFRGVDLDAFGGALLVTPKALVTVSNLNVTAYPLAGQAAVP